MFHGTGEGLEPTDLFFKWDLGFTGFAVGWGEVQQIKNKNKGNKIFLSITLICFC
jgi:hypothetical protein